MSSPQPDPEQGPQRESVPGAEARSHISRRHLIAGCVAAGVAAKPALAGQRVHVRKPAAPAAAQEVVIGPEPALVRRDNAFLYRVHSAKHQKDQPLPDHPDNGDETLYADRRGSYTKGLPHDAQGIVDPAAYAQYLAALDSGVHADFEALTMGSFRRFVSPQAAYAYHLEGPDSHALHSPPAPTFASPRTAGEMVEVYWQAICRDVPFTQWNSDPLIASACADMSALSDFGGASAGGTVVPPLAFRHSGFIDVVGPYVSQFLWLQIPAGALHKDQRYNVPVVGEKHVTTFAKWLDVQNGVPQSQATNYQPSPRYIATPRDLAEYVHKDYLFQGFLDAALYLCDLGGTFAATNPYNTSSSQEGFVTLGKAFAWDMLGRVTTAALKAVWFQKWLVHRRVRPEKFGAYVHRHMTGSETYDIHADLLNSQAVAEVFSNNGTYLCPMSYTEAAPLHPSYPSGHATVSGACATVMKALFNENFVLPEPVVANADGTALNSYAGPDLTIRSEIDKLAFNVGMGRNWSGIHYRSDIEEGMRLGEQVAIGILQDIVGGLNEPAEFILTAFDGSIITITP